MYYIYVFFKEQISNRGTPEELPLSPKYEHLLQRQFYCLSRGTENAYKIL